MYDNIIEAEKSGSLTDSDIAKMNGRFIHVFYCGLLSDIQTLIEKRNDLLIIEMYEMIEKANQELKIRYYS